MLGLSVPHVQQAADNSLSETNNVKLVPQVVAMKVHSPRSLPDSHNNGSGINKEADVAPISQAPEIVILNQNTERAAVHGDCSRFSQLNPNVATFKMRDPKLIHRGVLVPDLNLDWEHVERVQLGGVGNSLTADKNLWQSASILDTECSSLMECSDVLNELPF